MIPFASPNNLSALRVTYSVWTRNTFQLTFIEQKHYE